MQDVNLGSGKKRRHRWVSWRLASAPACASAALVNGDHVLVSKLAGNVLVQLGAPCMASLLLVVLGHFSAPIYTIPKLQAELASLVKLLG